MTESFETMIRDERYVEEIPHYKPISPAAVLGLAFAVAGGLAALSVADLGWAFLALPILAILICTKAFGSIRRYQMKGILAARVGVALSALAIVGGSAGYYYVLNYTIPAGYMPISYDPLQDKGGGTIPPEAAKLDGKKIYINGYVYPGNESRGIKSFVLCRDNGTCCFGGQPKLNDMVEVKLKDPLRLKYTSSLRGVGGTLRVQPEKVGDLGTVLYHIDDADVLH